MRLFIWIFSIIFAATAFGQTKEITQSKLKLGTASSTNKTIEFNVNKGATNPKIRATSSTGLEFSNDGILFKKFGSGSDASGSLISNGDFEDGNTAGWTCFKSAATTRPVDGMSFAGTPTVSMQASNTNPLLGGFSAVLTKPAGSSAQGEGCYKDIVIPEGLLGKNLDVYLDYNVATGTFTPGQSAPQPLIDSDVIVYFYDLDTNKVIEPSTFKLYNAPTTGSAPFISTFTPLNNTSKNIRLFTFHPTTTTAAFTLRLDTLSVQRSKIPNGAIVTDWRQYTPATDGFTLSYSNFWYRRVGDSAEIRGLGTVATTNASIAGIQAPGALDYNKGRGASTKTPIPGWAGKSSTGPYNTPSTNGGPWFLYMTSGDRIYFSLLQQLSADPMSTVAGSGIFNVGEQIYLNTTVPILGWSSGLQFASEAGDSRPVGMTAKVYTDYVITPAQGGTAAAIAPFTSVIDDSHGGYSNGRYTIPSSGRYRITASQFYNVASAGAWQIGVHLNGNTSPLHAGNIVPFGSNNYSSISYSQYFKQGDIIDVRPNVNTGSSNVTASSGGGNIFTVEKIGGGNGAIAASDPVSVIYYATSGQTITPSTYQNVLYNVKVEDNLGAYNSSTGVFRAPSSGRYIISANGLFQTASWVQYDRYELTVFKQGVIESVISYEKVPSAITTDFGPSKSTPCIVYLKEGETIEIKIFTSRTGNVSLNTGPQVNRLSITKVSQ